MILPGGGAMNRFQGGHVYWSRDTGAHWVIGSILTAYRAQGYQAGALGYPLAVVLAFFGVGALGWVLDAVLIRHLYGEPATSMLGTWITGRPCRPGTVRNGM